MAFRTVNNAASRLELAAAIATGSFTILYARRQVTDLNADTAELEFQGSSPSRIAGIVSSGNGTDFYGHATVGTTWVGAQTSVVASTVGQWTWRLVVGNGTSLAFYSSPDDASTGWTNFGGSPLTQTEFTVDDVFLGGNGREGAVIDYAAIRLWSGPIAAASLVAEKASPTAVITTGLLIDKLGTGASLSAALSSGTGSATTSGTVTLNSDLPISINTGSAPAMTPVAVGGAVQVDPLVTVTASTSADTVSFSGEYSSINASPTITALLKSGGSTVDTKTPTGAADAYSGTFTGVANGTYTVEVSIDDADTTTVGTATSDSVTVNSAAVPPAMPTALVVTAYTTSSVSLSWSDASASDSFDIEYRISGEAAQSTSDAASPATVSGLASNTAYEFRIRAVKGGLTSAYTDWVSQTTQPAAPNAPSVTAVTLSTDSIKIDYSEVATATSYKVYRKASPGGSRTLISTRTSADPRSFTDTGLSENSIYYYDVSATNVSGSTFSPEVYATTLQTGGASRVIVRSPSRAEVGAAIEITVQVVTGQGDPIAQESVVITPSLSVTGTTTLSTDVQGYAVFTLTPTVAGSLNLSAASASVTGSADVEVVEPGTEDAATIAVRLAAAEKKSTRTNQGPSPPPLESFAPPLELMPAEPISPLAALLNEMLLAPQMPMEPISLSEFMPAAPPQAPLPSGTQRAIEALDQAVAQQMQALNDQLTQLRRLVE